MFSAAKGCNFAIMFKISNDNIILMNVHILVWHVTANIVSMGGMVADEIFCWP